MTVFRVGAYIDGFNLYYGMRSHLGIDTRGWRWLDVRSMLDRYAQHWGQDKTLKVVYCTAKVNPATSQNGARGQQFYIDALAGSGSVDEVLLGHYVARKKYAYLVDPASHGRFPRPLTISRDTYERVVPHGFQPLPLTYEHATQMIGAQVQKIEEKGSDVNVATRLLEDTLLNIIDGALVLTNDSDLAEPIAVARKIIPVGVLNPHKGQISADLKPHRGTESVNRIGSFNVSLRPSDFTDHQLPEIVNPTIPVGTRHNLMPIRKPSDW